jgi:hypothetical protein
MEEGLQESLFTSRLMFSVGYYNGAGYYSTAATVAKWMIMVFPSPHLCVYSGH